MALPAYGQKPKRAPALKHVEPPDRIILAQLQKDDKISLGDVARMTGLASSSVHYRIKRLEDEGVIKGYRAIVDPVKLGYDILAVSFIRSKYDPRTYERLGRALSRIPGVWAAYLLIGDMDYVVLIRANNRLDLRRVVNHLITIK